MRRTMIRLFVLGLMVPVAIFTSGCPQGSGEQICLSTQTLDFGLTQNTLTFDVNNCGTFFTTAQFIVTPQSIPWVSDIQPSSGQSFNLGFGGGTPVTVTVTINRQFLAPGVVSTGIIIVGPTAPESSATPQVLTIRATGEGVAEGEGEEGEGEGGVEGEGEGGVEGEEGEGEEPIVCPEECGIPFCLSSGINAGVESALRALLGLPVLGQDPDTADLDNNGIIDVTHGTLVDIILANNELPVHCCVLEAWLNNEALVQQALDDFEASITEGENVVETIGRDVLEPVFIGLATIGERNTRNVLQNIIDTLQIPLDATQFDTSARMYLASDGDADLDGVCNLAEFRGANGDAFGFIFAAISADVTVDGGGCGQPCYGSSEGETEGGGGDGEGSGEGGTDGEFNPDQLCSVQLNQDQLPVPSGSAATGTATFSSTEGQVLVVVTHTVPDADSIGIYSGAPGATGALFRAFPSAVSPSFILLSESQYNTISRNHYVLITSVSRPGGAIRGNLGCADAEGEVEEGEGSAEGSTEGSTEGSVEGSTEGQAHTGRHSADWAAPLGRITLSEIIRVIQFFNNVKTSKGVSETGTYGCGSGEDGFTPGGTDRNCPRHDLDFLDPEWKITLNEILRLIQIYNSNEGAYYYCPGQNQEGDDFCLGFPPA